MLLKAVVPQIKTCSLFQMHVNIVKCLLSPSVRSIYGRNNGKHVVNDVTVKDFKLEKAVLMRKITRYEYEKQWKSNCSEDELKEYVSEL